MAVIKLFHNNPYTPLSYWCFAENLLDKTRIFLSKPYIDGRCGHELIKEETGGIIIFRIYWFEHIWLYNPQSSFSKDKIEPGFYLDIADNAEDDFSYIVLPVKYWNEIPVHRRPTTLVRSMVRSRLV